MTMPAAAIGPINATVGEAVFIERDRALIIPSLAGIIAPVGALAATRADDFLIDATSSPRIKVFA